MTATASPLRERARSHSPTLRLLHNERGVHAESPCLQGASQPTAARPALRLVDDRAHVLVAGGDACARATLLDELTHTMPASTLFEQAGAFAEVLEHAPSSRAVILSGDLDDIPASVLVHVLGNRHPSLPVVSVDAPAAVAR
jgi:hypothetical protein